MLSLTLVLSRVVCINAVSNSSFVPAICKFFCLVTGCMSVKCLNILSCTVCTMLSVALSLSRMSVQCYCSSCFACCLYYAVRSSCQVTDVCIMLAVAFGFLWVGKKFESFSFYLIRLQINYWRRKVCCVVKILQSCAARIRSQRSL